MVLGMLRDNEPLKNNSLSWEFVWDHLKEDDCSPYEEKQIDEEIKKTEVFIFIKEKLEIKLNLSRWVSLN